MALWLILSEEIKEKGKNFSLKSFGFPLSYSFTGNSQPSIPSV